MCDLESFYVGQGYIDASEESLNNTVQLGNKLVEDDHYAKPDIEEKVTILYFFLFSYFSFYYFLSFPLIFQNKH